MRTFLLPLALALCTSASLAAPVACADIKDAQKRLDCQIEERKAEVRRIAGPRFDRVSRAVAEFAKGSRAEEGLIAVHRENSKPAAWCESILRDVISQKNLTLVDDERTQGPRWIDAPDANGRRSRQASEILDPAFQERTAQGDTLVSGYVTLRWKNDAVVAVRVVSPCVSEDLPMRCHPQRYISVFVHDTEAPQACNATFVGRKYWPNWQATMTPIRIEPTGK